MFRIILDTNVLVAAMRSKRGASFALLSLVGSGAFEVCVSVPLVFEYEDVLLRSELGIASQDAHAVIDYICSVAHRQQVHFLWRPWLRDAKDDMVLEAAVAGQCSHIVTFNSRDFVGIEKFGLQALWPAEFLKTIGVMP
jgi:putative PIN family toxin of toxin-antitoxin system